MEHGSTGDSVHTITTGSSYCFDGTETSTHPPITNAKHTGVLAKAGKRGKPLSFIERYLGSSSRVSLPFKDTVHDADPTLHAETAATAPVYR